MFAGGHEPLERRDPELSSRTRPSPPCYLDSCMAASHRRLTSASSSNQPTLQRLSLTHFYIDVTQMTDALLETVSAFLNSSCRLYRRHVCSSGDRVR